MSRTAIFMTNTCSQTIDIMGCTGHVVLGDTRIVPNNGVRVLIATIGDPSTGKDNTGRVVFTGPLLDGTSKVDCYVELKKRTGKQMEEIGHDNEGATAPNSRRNRYSYTNDYADQPKSLYATSITINVTAYY